MKRRRSKGRTSATRCRGKVNYTARGFAEKVRRQLEAKSGETVRVYGCPECGGFHLTGKLRGYQQEAS